MGNFRHTGVADGTARTDYAALGQTQNGAFLWGGTAGGTANALTISLNPPLAAYAAGQEFRFLSGAAANTGAVTLNVNSLGALAVNKFDGTVALSAGDIPANTMLVVAYDGTRFRLISPAQVRGYVQIQQQAVSAVANVDFALPAGFRRFRLEIDRGRVATAGQALVLRCGVGAIFDAGASDYSWAFLTHTVSTGVFGTSTGTGIDVSGGLVVNELRSTLEIVIDPGSASEQFLARSSAGVVENTTPALRFINVFGNRAAVGAKDAIRVLASGGANISGTFTLFGIAS
jgi:hypothetical protein